MTERTKTRETPWWIAGTTEVCETCGQRHAYGMGRRCMYCDALVCSLCVLKTGDGEFVCAECHSGS